MISLRITEHDLAVLGVALHVHLESTPSTNDECLRLLERSEGDVLVTAGTQTAGRGRGDRRWHSPRGGLYFSLGLKGIDVRVLPLVVPVSLCEALWDEGCRSARIRWPNDILAGDGARGRKVAGVLIEARAGWGIVGVGVNLRGGSAEFPEGIAREAITLEDMGLQVNAGDLLVRSIANIRKNGRLRMPALLREYRGMCGTLGRRVRVRLLDGRDLSGTARDVSPEGHLIVECGRGESVEVETCIRLVETG